MRVPTGHIYLAIAFSLLVEMLKIRERKKRATPMALHWLKPRDLP